MKNCAKCRSRRPFSEFYKDLRASDGLYSSCRSCHKLTVTTRKFGVSRELYLLMRENQGGLCAICDKETHLEVDHDHGCCPGRKSCGDCLRLLLCHSCNSNLSMFELGRSDFQHNLFLRGRFLSYLGEFPRREVGAA